MNSKPTEAEIRARWHWDKIPIKATRKNIRLAVRRTKHCYGLTLAGGPYVEPQIGMQVACPELGTIVGLNRKWRGDPEAKIQLGDGRVIYKFQTALNGYRVVSLA